MDASSSSSTSIRSLLIKRVTYQISIDASRRDALQANLNNVSSMISRRDDVTQFLMSMNSTTIRDLAIMFMVDIKEKDQKYVEELTKEDLGNVLVSEFCDLSGLFFQLFSSSKPHCHVVSPVNVSILNLESWLLFCSLKFSNSVNASNALATTWTFG
ncbi:hypothetical protein L1987_01653 [Smallanthus sonchifolius]|uniref:Uncharacterized protein n=1 Tax=Smallanthus sonchifolius TaxID=185202 RepID=A0ACB9K5U1_9ASTR|nr:hypothetical protein L1987_01653 [Smallanthus sonchifolius]